MERNSRVLLQRGLLSQAGALAKEHLSGSLCAIITDETVDALWGDKAESSFANAGFQVARMAFSPGEASKTLSTYGQILDFLCQTHCTRKDIVIALGGGVVGDLAGFAAATYLRGVKLIQIPTTLLACVDSSIGGKTAIDLPAGKNLCGAFYQPDLVLCDPTLLSTLPEDVFSDGMAEVLKTAAITVPEIFPLCAHAREHIDEIIRLCIAAKRSIVDQDEKDTGIRQILNFGHTFGHGIEAVSNFTLSHGKGVAIGMAIMARACAVRGYCSREDAQALLAHIEAQGLPTATDIPADALISALLSDKKRMPDGLTLIELTGLGHCRMAKRSLEEVASLLREGYAQWT